jgi:phospholipase/carboxylesterase
LTVQTRNNAYTTYEQGWIVRIQPPVTAENSRTLLLLHGLTGDENVMWIFTRGVPENMWMLAPRAPETGPGSGYSWLPRGGDWPTLQDFVPVAERFWQAIRRIADDAGAPTSQIDVMGFSQGAALSYALAALYPNEIGRVIALAGFLPIENPLPGAYSALSGKAVYVAHGSADAIVPVEMAQQAVQVLQSAGARVTYCESDVGHKLSASCLRGLDRFLQE